MKRRPAIAPVVLLALVLVMLSVLVLGSATTLLPNAPLFPTPTQPKGIDFPDSRPVPRR